tara:strand:+ start:845 stop:1942 length:1098 start_codon:yes stop_codon:yes gene_type:complete
VSRGKVLILPGDNIGPEITREAVKVVNTVKKRLCLPIDIEYGLIGGAAIDIFGDPCPKETIASAKQSKGILLGAVGGPKWDKLELKFRPEQGLLKIRKELDFFANIRPAQIFDELLDSSSLKRDVLQGLDLVIVRELVGGIYFGEPRGIIVNDSGDKEGFNTYRYSESEIRRIAKIAFELAMQRDGRVCSVDKSNVLEATKLWREIITEVSIDFPEVTLSHMYVDNAAMQLIKDPKQFDVIVTGNMFGDILSDISAMLTGSIGMLPSASLNSSKLGLYEPCHGSAPDIAGKGIANPLATILSAAMMFRYSLGYEDEATLIESAVEKVLRDGYRTVDIKTSSDNGMCLNTSEMGDRVVDAICELSC